MTMPPVMPGLNYSHALPTYSQAIESIPARAPYPQATKDARGPYRAQSSVEDRIKQLDQAYRKTCHSFEAARDRKEQLKQNLRCMEQQRRGTTQPTALAELDLHINMTMRELRDARNGKQHYGDELKRLSKQYPRDRVNYGGGFFSTNGMRSTLAHAKQLSEIAGRKELTVEQRRSYQHDMVVSRLQWLMKAHYMRQVSPDILPLGKVSIFSTNDAHSKVVKYYAQSDGDIRAQFQNHLASVIAGLSDSRDEDRSVKKDLTSLQSKLHEMESRPDLHIRDLRTLEAEVASLEHKLDDINQKLEIRQHNEMGKGDLRKAKQACVGKLDKLYRETTEIRSPSSLKEHLAANGGERVTDDPWHARVHAEMRIRGMPPPDLAALAKDTHTVLPNHINGYQAAVGHEHTLRLAFHQAQLDANMFQTPHHRHAVDVAYASWQSAAVSVQSARAGLQTVASDLLHSKERKYVRQYVENMVTLMKRSGVIAGSDLADLKKLVHKEPRLLPGDKNFHPGRQLYLQDEAMCMQKALFKVLELASIPENQRILSQNLMCFPLSGYNAMFQLGHVTQEAGEFARSTQGRAVFNKMHEYLKGRGVDETRISQLKSRAPHERLECLRSLDLTEHARTDFANKYQYLFFSTSLPEMWDKETTSLSKAHTAMDNRQFKHLRPIAATLGIADDRVANLAKQGVENTWCATNATTRGAALGGNVGMWGSFLAWRGVEVSHPELIAIPGGAEIAGIGGYVAGAVALGPLAAWHMNRTKNQRLEETGARQDGRFVGSGHSIDGRTIEQPTGEKYDSSAKFLGHNLGRQKAALTTMNSTGAARIRKEAGVLLQAPKHMAGEVVHGVANLAKIPVGAARFLKARMLPPRVEPSGVDKKK